MKLFMNTIKPAEQYTTRVAQRRAQPLLFWSHPSIGNSIISSLPSPVSTERVVFPAGPHLSCSSGLALRVCAPLFTPVPRCRAFKSCSISSSFYSQAAGETIRHHVRPRSVRHQRGHHDPVRYGGGPEGERHRGDDNAAELAWHGGEGHLQRCAQSWHRPPVSKQSSLSRGCHFRLKRSSSVTDVLLYESQ